MRWNEGGVQPPGIRRVTWHEHDDNDSGADDSGRKPCSGPNTGPFPRPLVVVPTGPALYRLSVSQFDRMVATGILTENDRVELLEGVLVAKMSKNPPHRVATRKTVLALERVISADWHAAKEEALQISTSGKPEPDAAVVRAELEFDATRDATATDCSLVVEVADTTLDYDRTNKLQSYAAAGIAVYWIVNLVDRQIEVYSDPTGPALNEPDVAGYRRRDVFAPDDSVPVVIAGHEVGTISAADLLP